jgi:endonuclease YncB( thermonuclease family)
MAKAIEELQLSGGRTLTVGHFGLGMQGTGVGSVKQQVHDGDTINVRAQGNFGVRFLGVDAPEISFRLPDSGKQFISISDPRWETFLIDPFADQAGSDFAQMLSPKLLDHLQANLGVGVGTNHALHAVAAERELERQITDDIAELGMTNDTFQFFLAFGTEITDRFGRLLAYINRDQKATPRPLDYNTRLLKGGWVNPYLIWPNINPFRKESSLQAAVIKPGTANTIATKDSVLRDARESVQAARQSQIGVFDSQNPLRLQAFELRFLGERRLPARWVIDLSKNDDVLIPPQEYHTIPNVEDRLFIPADYLPLFEKAGWRQP